MVIEANNASAARWVFEHRQAVQAARHPWARLRCYRVAVTRIV